MTSNNIEAARRHVLKLSGVLVIVDEMTTATHEGSSVGPIVDQFVMMSPGTRESFLSGLDTIALVALDKELTGRANLLGKSSYPQQSNILRAWASAAQVEFPAVGALWPSAELADIGQKVARLRRDYPEFH